MNKSCPNCRLTNFAAAETCLRCRCDLRQTASVETENLPVKPKLLRRVIVCAAVLLFVVFGFYLSLIGSSKSLEYERKKEIGRTIDKLREKGFSDEAFLLEYLTAFRADDNWLNASVPKENAYAATNFPFEIITVYPDFFTYPLDDTERAAILLHEAQHLKGADEKKAYTFVWKNRQKLGWTKEFYKNSIIWRNVRKQTMEYAPELFACPENEGGDCAD